MPTGFDTPSGAWLPLRLEKWRLVILKILKEGRWHERTSGHPFSAGEITAQVKAFYSEDLTDVDIRAIVNSLRRDGQPIGSGAKGYFYACCMSELAPTILHLKERIAGIQAAVDGLSSAFLDKEQQLL